MGGWFYHLDKLQIKINKRKETDLNVTSKVLLWSNQNIILVFWEDCDKIRSVVQNLESITKMTSITNIKDVQ